MSSIILFLFYVIFFTFKIEFLAQEIKVLQMRRKTSQDETKKIQQLINIRTKSVLKTMKESNNFNSLSNGI